MCEISSLICRPTKRQKSKSPPVTLWQHQLPRSVTGHHAWPPFNLETTGSTSYGDTHLCQKTPKKKPSWVLCHYLTTCCMATCTHLFINKCTLNSLDCTTVIVTVHISVFVFLYNKVTILNCTCYCCCPSMCFILLPDTSCFFFTAAKSRSFHRFLPLLCRALLGSLAMLCASCRWWWSVHHRRFFRGMTW